MEKSDISTFMIGSENRKTALHDWMHVYLQFIGYWLSSITKSCIMIFKVAKTFAIIEIERSCLKGRRFKNMKGIWVGTDVDRV